MNEVIDAILIDDDPLIQTMWDFSAQKNCKRILAFSCAKEFFDYFSKFKTISNSHVAIYIDSNLGNGLKGEVVAKNIYDLGYKVIYLITGKNKEEFSANLYWITNILGKEPPW